MFRFAGVSASALPFATSGIAARDPAPAARACTNPRTTTLKPRLQRELRRRKRRRRPKRHKLTRTIDMKRARARGG